MNPISPGTEPRNLSQLLRYACPLAAATALLALFTAPLAAQTTGTITGRVYDESTSRSLQGPIVRAAGTASVDYTDAEGRYTLPGLPPGPVRVEFEYVGLDPLSQPVTATAGVATNRSPPALHEIPRARHPADRDRRGGRGRHHGLARRDLRPEDSGRRTEDRHRWHPMSTGERR